MGEEQYFVIGLGVILELQTPKVGAALIMEIAKLHSVAILVRDDLPQKRDLG